MITEKGTKHIGFSSSISELFNFSSHPFHSWNGNHRESPEDSNCGFVIAYKQ